MQKVFEIYVQSFHEVFENLSCKMELAVFSIFDAYAFYLFFLSSCSG